MTNKQKAINLVDYLIRLASLRTKIVRDINDYENILWLSEIPQQKLCFTQAWGRDEEYDSDIWIEIQTRREPELPTIPYRCEGWVDKSILRKKDDLPQLLSNRIIKKKNPIWNEGTDQSEYLQVTEYLENFPELQKTWDRYLEEQWFPWVEDHNSWEKAHKVYSKLFAIHQEQLRLGEEYELVLGLGLLTWQTPTGQRVHRHLIVADAVLEFEARLGKFSVRPHPEGAKLRPELDMLDLEDQPIHAEENAKAILTDFEDDPWDRDCIDGVLQALVHSINFKGEYNRNLKKEDIRASEKPIVEYAPALILRKRSTKGLSEILKVIKERVANGDSIPGKFADLAEMGDKIDGELGDSSVEQCNIFDGEIFFPKPSNEEQRRIVEKLRSASGVLVQGPPGTGKSHTIANLICHLFATGQRTLITAKTPRALQVLEGLLPLELRPLCINLLGSGAEERRSLESSVSGILRQHEQWNENHAKREQKELEENLQRLREEQSKINRRLHDIRESETHVQSIADGAYRGTAARISELINRDRGKYEWFTDKISVDQTCPFNVIELKHFLNDLRDFSDEKCKELQLLLPEELPSIDYFAKLVQDEKNALAEDYRVKEIADEQVVSSLLESNSVTIEELQKALSRYLDSHRKLLSSTYSWMGDAIRDVIYGNTAFWLELACLTNNVITSVEPFIDVADNTSVEIPKNTKLKTLYDDTCKLKEYMENGGKLGWVIFRPKIVKDRFYIIKTVQIDGHPCSTVEHLLLLCNVLHVQIEFDKAWMVWDKRIEKVSGPYALQLTLFKSMYNALSNTFNLGNLVKQCNQLISFCSNINTPDWTDELQVKKLITSCQLALIRFK
jgi:hypothetical protein